VAKHPPTLARLREEHARILGGRAPEVADLPALIFTKAVIQEGMRLFPPVPYLSRQAAAPDRIGPCRRAQGRHGAGHHLAAAPPGPALGRPHAFRPERFLPDAPRKPPRFGYLPFSLGPRVCVGASFAMAEMMVFLSVLLQRLDVTADPAMIPVPGARLTLRPQTGMRLTLTPRS
jgi:cytochrome P450